MSDRLLLTVLGTADLHGCLLNWDYFADREFDHDGEKVGLATVASLVRRIRDEREYAARRAGEPAGTGRERVLLLDAGDTISGTQLAYYHARVEPITENRIHPMAAAMNALEYDAAVPGNHDFDYGLPLLSAWQRQLTFPLLAANVTTRHGKPAFRPYLIRSVPGDSRGPVRVGVLGLGNPGTEVWDRYRLSGELIFSGLVEQARYWVPRVRAEGADVVLVVAHAGTNGRSTYFGGTAAPENAAAQVAAEVPGVDAILAGHAHEEIDQLVVTNQRTGRPVVITEPLAIGARLSVIELTLSRSAERASAAEGASVAEGGSAAEGDSATERDRGDEGGWRVTDRGAFLLKANTAEPDPEIVRLASGPHRDVVRYLDTTVGTSVTEIRVAGSTCRPTVATDLVNHVQAGVVHRGLRGTEHARLPVLSVTSLCNKRAVIPAGRVAVRDIAALYPYDNLLLAVRMTGAQLREYLEESAVYFRRVDGPGPFRPSELTHAPTSCHPGGAPDYNYDVLGGWDAPVAYDIDISAEPGHRIVGLSHAGKPIPDEAEFVVAVSDYRQSGGGCFPHVSAAPVVYDRRQEVRQLLLEWVRARGRIDPSEFTGGCGSAWRLVSGTSPIPLLDDAK